MENVSVINFLLGIILAFVLMEYLMRMIWDEKFGLLPSNLLILLVSHINHLFYRLGYLFANLMDIFFIYEKILHYSERLYRIMKNIMEHFLEFLNDFINKLRRILLKILIKFKKFLKYTPLYDILKFLYIILDLFKIIYNFSLGYSGYLKDVLELRMIIIKLFSCLFIGILFYFYIPMILWPLHILVIYKIFNPNIS